MAATIGGVPSAAPMPVIPLSVSTRINVASLFTLVPRSVRWRFAIGTGADIGMADTFVIFMASSVLQRHDTATRIEQHVADPRTLHHVKLHRTTDLSDAACDVLHRLHNVRMIGLAWIAETLREIVG